MSILRLRSWSDRHRSDPPPSTTVEPCVQCLEETAAGSVFYSDRLVITRTDGGRSFLCSDCCTRARAAKLGEPLTEADLQVIADNGLMISVGLGLP
jgi:hypothetical protein